MAAHRIARGVNQLAAILDSSELQGLIIDLEETRWTGRPGYPIRSMVGMCLIKAVYALPTWSRTARLVAEHEGLQRVLGCVPSQFACYRFAKKLRENRAMLDVALDRVIQSLTAHLPNVGTNVAVDGSDLPAYANGQRFLSKNGPERERYSDPDASWGHRSAVGTRKGGGFYGFKLHAVVDVKYDLPLAWTVETAKEAEANLALLLIDAARARKFVVRTAIMDKGYDSDLIHQGCMDRGIAPVTSLRETDRVKRGEHLARTCDHGTWTFAGADFKRRQTKWRCPTGVCTPASIWIKADRLHPLIPRESKRSKALYASRGAIEREFGRLKNEWAMLPLRVRGLERVRLHVDLTILARLACRLAVERALPVAA